MFDAGMLAAPFLAGALFQAGYLYLYQRCFGDKDPVPAVPVTATAQAAEPGSR